MTSISPPEGQDKTLLENRVNELRALIDAGRLPKGLHNSNPSMLTEEFERFERAAALNQVRAIL